MCSSKQGWSSAVVRCSAADSPLQLLSMVISSISFLTGNVFEFNLAHRHAALQCGANTITIILLYKKYPNSPSLWCVAFSMWTSECHTWCSDFWILWSVWSVPSYCGVGVIGQEWCSLSTCCALLTAASVNVNCCIDVMWLLDWWCNS